MAIQHLPQHPSIMLAVFFTVYIIVVQNIKSKSAILAFGSVMMVIVMVYLMDVKIQDPNSATQSARTHLRDAYEKEHAAGKLNHAYHACAIQSSHVPETLTWVINDNAVVDALLRLHTLAMRYDIQVFINTVMYCELFYKAYHQALQQSKAQRHASGIVDRMTQLRQLLINHVQALHPQTDGRHDAQIARIVRVLQAHTYSCIKRVSTHHMRPAAVSANASSVDMSSFEWLA